MANVNLALDDIITKQKKTNRRGIGRKFGVRKAGGRLMNKRNGGSFGREKYFSEDVPSGKWKHDKFFDVYGKGRNNGINGSFKRIQRESGNKIVKLNISNIPENVLTSDLEELFQDFDVLGVTVHYDETGAHLGTADLFTTPVSSRNIIREYADIAIDGQPIKIGVVEEGGRGIKDRVRRIGNGSGGIRQRRNRNGGGRIRRRNTGGRISKPLTENNGIAKLKKMTVEELDKELEAYMGGRQGKE